MWAALNRSNLELYGAGRSPSHRIGACNASCAEAYWRGVMERSGVPKLLWLTTSRPVCGVPGCEAERVALKSGLYQ